MEAEEQLLKEKAKLLLQRERELFELRLRLDQLTSWLSFGQTLSEMFLNRSCSPEEVWNRLRKSLVSKLRLQRVLLLEVRAASLYSLAPIGPERALSSAARSLLDAQPWGLCNDPEADSTSPAVAALAQTLGLHQFMWTRIACPGRAPILMAAGFDHTKAAFHSPFLDNDTAHFNNAAQYVESLLANALLVAELEAEKNQLHQAYATLEQRDRALQEAAEQLRAANETLEERVRERTRALADKNRELRELPRRIQTSILPKSTTAAPAITVSSRMTTAEEVGGDYYDVLPVADGAWIAVGDVSGHGLEAGLITFMLQSAVATLTAARPAATPSELLTLLNTVMYKNIRERLKSDDHVTFVLLRVFEDGRVLFAGSHEDLLVYRAKTGACEIVPTRGTWLGAVPNIKSPTVDEQIRLDPGDLLVAFTDGLIESRNAAGDMFGLERLCSEIVRWGERSTDELCDRVWTTVEAWCPCPEDDLSLLAIRFHGVA